MNSKTYEAAVLSQEPEMTISRLKSVPGLMYVQVTPVNSVNIEENENKMYKVRLDEDRSITEEAGFKMLKDNVRSYFIKDKDRFFDFVEKDASVGSVITACDESGYMVDKDVIGFEMSGKKLKKIRTFDSYAMGVTPRGNEVSVRIPCAVTIYHD